MWVFKNKYFHIASGWEWGFVRSLDAVLMTMGAIVYTEAGRQAVANPPASQQHASQAEEERGERAIEFTICCDIFTIMGRRLHYIKYNKIRHKNNGVSRFKSIHSRLSC